jgi:hypothetical protein
MALIVKLALREHTLLYDQNQSKPISKGYTQYHSNTADRDMVLDYVREVTALWWGIKRDKQKLNKDSFKIIWHVMKD